MRLTPLERGPQIGIKVKLLTVRFDDPAAGLLRRQKLSAARQGVLNTKEHQKEQFRLGPVDRHLGFALISKPPVFGPRRQDSLDFFGPDRLTLLGRAKGDAKEPYPRRSTFGAFGNQGQLGSTAMTGHRHEFNPIADCANRANKVMTNPRADKRGKVFGSDHCKPCEGE